MKTPRFTPEDIALFESGLRMKKSADKATFPYALIRLKKQLGVSKDQEVAEFLNMGKTAFSARKRRNSFPEKELYALAANRPDLKIDVNYVLLGIDSQAQALHLTASPDDMNAAALTAQELRAISDVLMASFEAAAGRLQLLCARIANLRPSASGPSLPGLPAECSTEHGPALTDGAPAANRHCVAPFAPCATVAIQQLSAPAHLQSLHGLS